MIKLPEWIKKVEVSLPPQLNAVPRHEMNILKQTQFYFHSIWKRITDWKNYPRNYMIIYECNDVLSLYHFKNNLLIHKQDITISEYDWREYISQHGNLPIYIVLQGQDCEFRVLPTHQIRFWDRFFLFNQIKTNEFNIDDSTNHYQSKESKEKTDIFVSIRANETLKKLYKVLSLVKNPIAAVLSWDIEQSIGMKKNANVIRSLRHWTVSLIPINNDSFTILVMHQDKILLQRVIVTKNHDDLEKELCSTLQFLQRQGYKNGQAVSVLIPEGSTENNSFSNTELEIVTVSKRFLEKEGYNPTKGFLNLLPRTLTQANLAYELPRRAIKFLIPVSTIFLILWASIQIKSFFQDYENKWLNVKYDKVIKKTSGNFSEQVHLSKLFIKYLAANNKNPSYTINAINRLLRGKAQVIGVVWSPTEHGSDLRLKFSATAKKNQDLKKYINNNYERVLGNVVLSWDEQGNETLLLIQQQGAQNAN